MCHYCGKTVPYSNICPSCGEPYLQNHGIGTQQVEEQVKKLQEMNASRDNSGDKSQDTEKQIADLISSYM